MKIIRINKDGSMNEINIKCNKNFTNLLIKNCNSKGEGNIKELYSWKYENNTIKCYGWFDGDAGFENKHELPPNGHSSFLEEDSSSKLLFGDLFILYFSDKDKQIDISVSDYSCFYEYINEGFDDCESEDEGFDEETEDDKNFIVDDSSEDEDYSEEEEENMTTDDESSDDNEDLLDNDLNEY